MTEQTSSLEFTLCGKQRRIDAKHLSVGLLVLLRGCLLLLQLLVQVIVARFFGAATLGVVQLFVTYTSTVGEICLLGKPANAMRQISRLSKHSQATQVFRFILQSLVIVFMMVAIASVIIGCLQQFDLITIEWVAILPWALLGYCSMRVLSESLKAINQPRLALTLEVGVIPLCLLASLALIDAQSVDKFLYVYAAAFCTAALLLLTAIAVHIKRRFIGIESHTIPVHSQWRSLWFSGLLGIVYGQFALLALPYFVDMETVGINSAAFRYIALTTTLMMVLASFFAPKFSQAHKQPKTLKRLLRQSQLFSIIIFAPFALAFLLIPELLLSIFGADFAAAKLTLQCLTVAQLVNAATGIPGVLLKMTGKAHWEQNILIACLIFAVIGLLLIGSYNKGLGVIIIFSLLISLKNLLSYIAATHLLAKLPPKGVLQDA